MNIMVIDRDALTNQLLATRLEALGHQVVTYQNKNEAFEILRQGNTDCVIVDPAPLAEPRPIVIAVWQNITTTVKPYVLLLSKTATMEEAIQAGANDVLNKPISTQDIEIKMYNADRLTTISRHLEKEDDAHSGDGMVGKAAFNQLFHSANDRAIRYGERSLIIFLHIKNYDELAAKHTPETLRDIMRKLNTQMTYMRRQSDVVGRIGTRDFAVMLQRPQFDSEGFDALNRFSEHLDKLYHSFTDKSMAPEIELDLVEIPQGILHAQTAVPLPQIESAEVKI